MERWRALRQQALADAIMDALLARRAEARRPEALRWPEWDAREANVVRRSLDALEAEAGSFGKEFTIGHATIACALSYIDFRFPDEDWRPGRDGLARWYAEVSKRPSMVATALSATS